MSDGLRLLRVYNDMKAGELATELGVSNSYLSEIEKGHKNITLELLKKYAEVFKTSPSTILAFTEEYDKEPANIKNVIKKKIMDLLTNIEELANEVEKEK